MPRPRRTHAIAARVPPSVRTILVEHAEECQRTLSTEVRLWAEFAAATIVFRRLSAPDVEETPEIDQARASAREDMGRYLGELLSHAVLLPEPLLLPALSMN